MYTMVFTSRLENDRVPDDEDPLAVDDDQSDKHEVDDAGDRRGDRALPAFRASRAVLPRAPAPTARSPGTLTSVR
jgi:hypothetical protein